MEIRPSSFLKDDSSDPVDPQEVLCIRKYRVQIEEIRDLFRFKMDLRKVGPPNIDELESSLRKILMDLHRLENTPNFSYLLSSYDAVQSYIEQAIDNLYIASSILELPQPSLSKQRQLFKMFRECHRLLDEALDHFLV